MYMLFCCIHFYAHTEPRENQTLVFLAKTGHSTVGLPERGNVIFQDHSPLPLFACLLMDGAGNYVVILMNGKSSIHMQKNN